MGAGAEFILFYKKDHNIRTILAVRYWRQYNTGIIYRNYILSNTSSILKIQWKYYIDVQILFLCHLSGFCRIFHRLEGESESGGFVSEEIYFGLLIRNDFTAPDMQEYPNKFRKALFTNGNVSTFRFFFRINVRTVYTKEWRCYSHLKISRNTDSISLQWKIPFLFCLSFWKLLSPSKLKRLQF